VEDAQVERQHRGYENIEQNPDQGLVQEWSRVLGELEMKIMERESRLYAGIGRAGTPAASPTPFFRSLLSLVKQPDGF
jgi:hypothetical protein